MCQRQGDRRITGQAVQRYLERLIGFNGRVSRYAQNNVHGQRTRWNDRSSTGHAVKSLPAIAVPFAVDRSPWCWSNSTPIERLLGLLES